jgi:hypothetical protein
LRDAKPERHRQDAGPADSILAFCEKMFRGIYGMVLRNFGKLGRQHLSGFRVVFKEKIGDSPLRVKTYAGCCAESGRKT